MTVFTGVGVALVTIFAADGAADVASTAALAGDLADRGVRAVLACGTTGEAATLTDAERTAIVVAVRSAVPPASRYWPAPAQPRASGRPS